MNGKDTEKKVKPKSTTATPKPKPSGSQSTKAENEYLECLERLIKLQERDRLSSDRWAVTVMRSYFMRGYLLGTSFILVAVSGLVVLNIALIAFGVDTLWVTLINIALGILVGGLTGKGLTKFVKAQESEVKLWEKVNHLYEKINQDREEKEKEE